MSEQETVAVAKVEAEKLPRNLKLYIWRKRSRGFLVVLACNIKDARATAIADNPRLKNFVAGNDPEVVMNAKEGAVALVKQR